MKKGGDTPSLIRRLTIIIDCILLACITTTIVWISGVSLSSAGASVVVVSSATAVATRRIGSSRSSDAVAVAVVTRSVAGSERWRGCNDKQSRRSENEFMHNLHS